MADAGVRGELALRESGVAACVSERVGDDSDEVGCGIEHDQS